MCKNAPVETARNKEEWKGPPGAALALPPSTPTPTSESDNSICHSSSGRPNDDDDLSPSLDKNVTDA